MGDEWTRADLGVEVVREMVAELLPAWTVDAVERSEYGTDFVGILDVGTPTGERRVVLKATTADLVDPVVARSEPRLFEFVAAETDIPVPDVYGYCDAHESYPAPFYLVEYVSGETLEDDASVLSERAIRRVLRDAGENLAALHECGPIDGVGTVGVRGDELVVLDTDDHPKYDDGRTWAYDNCMETLDALEDGGWFAEKADEPGRFRDIVPELREYVEETVFDLPAPEPPTYCHWDYRYGNLLIVPETGETTAVLDWANLAALEPAYNLTKAQAHLLDVGDPDDQLREERRETFRTAYISERDDWAFTDAIEERMRFYRFQSEVQAMACLPLWHEDATPSERDAVAASHRSFLQAYL